MVAGEEGRSRQYEGTAMSHDEASKVPQIIAFGNFIDKSIINICSIIRYFCIIEKSPALCGARIFDRLKASTVKCGLSLLHIYFRSYFLIYGTNFEFHKKKLSMACRLL